MGMYNSLDFLSYGFWRLCGWNLPVGLCTMISELTAAIGARPSNKYPFLSLQNMPKTDFSCRDKILGGYYSDAETQCQMFHICVKVAGVGVSLFTIFHTWKIKNNKNEIFAIFSSYCCVIAMINSSKQILSEQWKRLFNYFIGKNSHEDRFGSVATFVCVNLNSLGDESTW